jgi:inner membrane protein
MHVQTHIMSGWCVGNWLSLTARQRLCCMIATSIADLDGLSILFGQEAYWNWHHKLCHNLAFAVLISTVLTIWSSSRFFGFVVYLAFAHLHLVLDYFGSGPGWPLYYLWPFSSDYIVNRNAWEFYSWQNITAAAVLFVLTLFIAVRCGRTPLENIMPNLDKEIVRWLRRRVGYPSP